MSKNEKVGMEHDFPETLPELIETLKNLIISEDFCYRHKVNSNDFIRNRILPFHDLVFFLLNMNNKSYQAELDRYFQAVHHTEVPKTLPIQRKSFKSPGKAQTHSIYRA